jgi:pimeloyl-ACP methyl ester carboxylesterase
MRTRRRRDAQQWILDLAVKLTGRPQNFEYDEREVPTWVKSHRMIPRAYRKLAEHEEAIARAAEAAGRIETARALYFRAADLYREAQHAIYVDNAEKRYLHGKLLECYEKVIRYSPYPIEKVEIPWPGPGTISGLLHRAGDGPAPTVLFVPGMDRTKEAFPDPANNVFTRRGMHVLAIDGPGQGETRLRGIVVTLDNYELAGKAAVDYLLARGLVADGKIGVCGISMGTYWATRIAAYDPRIRAYAGAAACYGPKLAIFEESSPRMAGMDDEERFDEMAAAMTTDGLGSRIRCPFLMVVGEFDPLCPLEDAYRLFDELAGPKEIWVMENEAHTAKDLRGLGSIGAYAHLADWLRDALEGRIPPDHCVVRYIPQQGGLGPYTPPAAERPWAPAH